MTFEPRFNVYQSGGQAVLYPPNGGDASYLVRINRVASSVTCSVTVVRLLAPPERRHPHSSFFGEGATFIAHISYLHPISGEILATEMAR